MKPWNKLWLGLATAFLMSQAAQAQDAGAAAVPGGAQAAAAGPNLFSMLLPNDAQKEKCRQKLCKCEIVKMLKAAMRPASAMTGGLIPSGNCCPEVKKEDLLKPSDSPEGAAAQIKKDAEEAAARRAAVRFLGTVDCRYWPEAEDALIAALRGDKIECVRWEAAIALQRGCCCTTKIRKALTLCVESSDKDGHPAERSTRVLDAATCALTMCTFEETPAEKAKEKEKEKEKEIKKIGRVNPKEYYQNLDKESPEKVLEAARRAVEQRTASKSAQILAAPHRASSQGLLGIFTHAVDASQEPPTAQPRTQAPAPVAVVQQQPQPQRRGLLYKLMPGLGGEEVASAPPTVVEPRGVAQVVVAAPVAAAQIAPVVRVAPVQIVPAAPGALVVPVANNIRPVGYTYSPPSVPVNPNPGFSTACPTQGCAPVQPYAGSAGQLGIVIVDDSPRR